MVGLIRSRGKAEKTIYDRFVLLLGAWWLIDMVFVWISPRSYDQYYLPLNASAAMLGGYMICLFRERWGNGESRGMWNAVGVVGLLVMVVMVWPIVFGISRSPHHGGPYRNKDGEPIKKNGYVQKMAEVRARRAGDSRPMWEVVAEMVAGRSVETDRLYVWGWYPGMYVMSQRDSATNRAVYGNMHSDPPDTVGRTIADIVRQLEAEPPKFIIDAQKLHYPFYDHLNFDLWPRGRDSGGQLVYMPVESLVSQREDMLDFAETEAFKMMTAAGHANGPIAENRARELAQMERARNEAMFPLREFVMRGYEPILPPGNPMFVFQRKDSLGR